MEHPIITGWWFGTFFIFHNIWDVILPIDELIFFKMVIAPPSRSTSWLSLALACFGSAVGVMAQETCRTWGFKAGTFSIWSTWVLYRQGRGGDDQPFSLHRDRYGVLKLREMAFFEALVARAIGSEICWRTCTSHRKLFDSHPKRLPGNGPMFQLAWPRAGTSPRRSQRTLSWSVSCWSSGPRIGWFTTWKGSLKMAIPTICLRDDQTHGKDTCSLI